MGAEAINQHLGICRAAHRILHLRHGLACEGGFVDNRAAPDDEAIAWHQGVLLLLCLSLHLVLIRLCMQRDQISGQEFLDWSILPLATPVHKDVEALGAHAPELRHGLQALQDRGGLEHQNAAQGEAGVLPESVHNPQGCREELKDHQWRNELLLEELPESRLRQVKDVLPELVLCKFHRAARPKSDGIAVVAPRLVRGALDEPHAWCIRISQQIWIFNPCLDEFEVLVLELEVAVQSHLRFLH
mmetsp:Transcript_78651/g.188708  ORF Transcript_78651/g.188708 Transcript_78651/m.188708 type:complete len:244 (-) Transcript_78651:154-885(-)